MGKRVQAIRDRRLRTLAKSLKFLKMFVSDEFPECLLCDGFHFKLAMNTTHNLGQGALLYSKQKSVAQSNMSSHLNYSLFTASGSFISSFPASSVSCFFGASSFVSTFIPVDP